MAPLTKVYNTKIRRRSSQDCPPLSDRTGLSILEIPPRLCHLTGDALAEPFPPIAVGGYIKYYRKHAGPGGRRETKRSASPSRNTQSDPQTNKARRRASSASLLVNPFLSHNPQPSPSKEVPPKSQLFGTTRIQISSPISSSCRIPVPQSPRQRYLSIIPEASRETMRVDLDADTMFTSKSRKPRVVSLPPFPTSGQSSPLTSSGFNNSITSDPPSPSITSNSVKSANSATLSRTTALRRSNRRLLRTPSVENDFAPYAKEMMNIPKSDTDIPRQLSRQYSSGSDGTDEEGAMSATESVNTAITSLLEPSLSSSTPPSSPSSLSSPVSSTKCPAEEFSNADNNILPTSADSSPNPAVDCPQLLHIFDLFHSNGSESLDDWSLQTFLELGSKSNDSEKRDSWTSFTTAKSFSDLLSMVDEVAENSPQDILNDDQLVVVGIAL